MCAETTKVTPPWIFIPFTARNKKNINLSYYMSTHISLVQGMPHTKQDRVTLFKKAI